MCNSLKPVIDGYRAPLPASDFPTSLASCDVNPEDVKHILRYSGNGSKTDNRIVVYLKDGRAFGIYDVEGRD